MHVHRDGISKVAGHTYRKWTHGHTAHLVTVRCLFRTVCHAIRSPSHLGPSAACARGSGCEEKERERERDVLGERGRGKYIAVFCSGISRDQFLLDFSHSE